MYRRNYRRNHETKIAFFATILVFVAITGIAWGVNILSAPKNTTVAQLSADPNKFVGCQVRIAGDTDTSHSMMERVEGYNSISYWSCSLKDGTKEIIVHSQQKLMAGKKVLTGCWMKNPGEAPYLEVSSN